MSGGELFPCPVDGCEWKHFERFYEATVDTLASVFGPGVVLATSNVQRKQNIETALEQHFSTHTTLEFIRTITRLANENERLRKAESA